VIAPPIKPVANGKIWIANTTGGVTIDPDTGNEVTSSTLTELPVYFTRDKSLETFERQPGVKTESIALRGYILSSQVDIGALSATVKATFQDGSGIERNGEFDFSPVVSPFSSEIRRTIGVPIRGVFRASEV
jgi:hypothetical protein